MSAGPRGGALPLVLLLLLALTGLALGVLHLAMSELQTVTASRHAWKATQAAKGALERGFVALDSLLPQGGWGAGGAFLAGETPEGLLFTSRLHWLGSEYFLLEGVGGSRGWPGGRLLGWVGWSLDPSSRIGAFQGAVEVGGGVRLQGTGSISLLPPDSGSAFSPPDACQGYEVVLDSLFRGRPLSAWVFLSEEEVEEGREPGAPGLGLLRGPVLLSRAGDLPPGGEGWGHPSGEELGCLGSRGAVFAGVPGSLTLGEETLCGLVVVAGDLILREGALVHGLALIGGDLLVEQGGRLEGLARVRGTATLADGSRVVGSACAALWALNHLAALRRPYRLPDGYRIHGF